MNKTIDLTFNKVSQIPITAGVASMKSPFPPSALMISWTTLPSYLHMSRQGSDMHGFNINLHNMPFAQYTSTEPTWPHSSRRFYHPIVTVCPGHLTSV